MFEVLFVWASKDALDCTSVLVCTNHYARTLLYLGGTEDHVVDTHALACSEVI